MAGRQHRGAGWLGRFFRRLTEGMVADVSPEMARCEFDCHDPLCTHEQWENCHRRKTATEGERRASNRD
jgi:hypothetical protein